ncbi:MAG: response regulator transcription factor [Anaerolineales bacterium]
MKPTKVLITIESQFMGDVFSDVLNDEPDITVVGCASTIDNAIKIIRENEADVVLVSIHLPSQGALELIRTIKEVAPSIKILALGLLDNENLVLEYVEAGAVGYILQESSVDELIEAVRLTQREEAKVSTKVAAALLDRLSKLSIFFTRVESNLLEKKMLTNRELEVLEYIYQGFTNQEIASQLVLEVGTVKNHIHNILKKLNVSSRKEAATYLAYIRK